MTNCRHLLSTKVAVRVVLGEAAGRRSSGRVLDDGAVRLNSLVSRVQRRLSVGPEKNCNFYCRNVNNRHLDLSIQSLNTTKRGILKFKHIEQTKF
jgi:hypothetical protein